MSSFKSVLDKIGIVLLKGGELATQIMGFPFISHLIGELSSKMQSTITTVAGDWNTVASIASMMQVAFPLSGSGSQRLAAGAPLVQQGILLWAKSNLPGHDKVKDPALLAQGASKILSGFADCMGSLGE